MFEDRSYKRTFYSAPQSVQSLIAAFLEPGLIVAVLLAALAWCDEPVARPVYVLCLLVFALTFPGRDRFLLHPVSAILDVLGSWLTLLAILAAFGYATNSLKYFEPDVLMFWAVATPLAQTAAIGAGRLCLRWMAGRPQTQRPALIVGAGELGAKVARALGEDPLSGRRLLGFFDDRDGERLDASTQGRVLGRLAELPHEIERLGVREVYITLPLGSQPRLVKLLENLQGTTASLYFVPDVFGISIIQGRLKDLNGVPVVGICETPFTGTNAAGQARRRHRAVLPDPGADRADPAGRGARREAQLTRAGDLQAAPQRPGRRGDRGLQVPLDARDGRRQRGQAGHQGRPAHHALRRLHAPHLAGRTAAVRQRAAGPHEHRRPRPHAVAHNEQYRQLIKAYMVRHKVKPGITGWAQVNGLRGETDTLDKMRQRVEYDLEYLRNWSLALDLQIIVRTARLMLFDRNAY
jgi:putative colanic acid biosynthesis UDP-glucose lipid carrier transferase